jgi:hypothetical protein
MRKKGDSTAVFTCVSHNGNILHHTFHQSIPIPLSLPLSLSLSLSLSPSVVGSSPGMPGIIYHKENSNTNGMVVKLH